MSRAVLKDILHNIEALDETERLELDRLLTARLEKQWNLEAAKARKVAKQRGIDQAVIDRTIEHRRYGR